MLLVLNVSISNLSNFSGKTFLSTFICIFIFSLLILIIEFLVIKNIVFKLIIIILFILTYLINPGINFKENNNNGSNYYCNICQFTFPKNEKKYEHCSLCNICIPGSDHHCGIFEKCIGRKNLICFYLFPTFSILLLIIFVVSIFFNVVKNETKK